MNFVVLLFLFFAFLGVLLSLLFLFRKKGDRVANIILAAYTLLFSFELLNNCLRWSGELYTASFVHINLTHFPLWVIYGPLVFIYVRRVVKNDNFRISDLLFLVPPLIIIGLLWPFYELSTAEKLQVVQAGETFNYAIFPSYGIWVVIAIMAFYALFTYFRFWRDKGIGLRENTWLKWFVGSYFGFVLAFFAYIFLVRFQIMDAKYDYFIDLIIVFFIGMLAFFGFVQPHVFEGKSIKELIPFVKYRKTGLSNALSLEMKEKLTSIMEREQLFLHNDLRLDDVARELNLSRNHASQIINEHFNLSFFDYINKYRVDEAKKLLLEHKSEGSTIAQLAYDVGFNNRASFYKAFKKFTDVSPSNYLKHIRAS